MIRYFFRRLTEDNGIWWIIKFDKLRLFCFKGLSTFLVRIICSIRGIKLEKNCSFFGIPRFYRKPFSKIIVGKHCTFRSDQSSNLIGVNHRCILSTHQQGASITIGDECGFSGVTIGAASKIQIGHNVLCGANVVITDFDWHTNLSKTEPEPVTIQDNVWIGLNTVVLKGVVIGENSIIGANSLVLKSIPANVVAGGNPCKVLKSK
jgi:acetyltransferase-like isoleucine patch superfamily enzyme